MKLTRLYTGLDGESHFEKLADIILEDVGHIGKLSSKLEATGMLIHQYDSDLKEEWHNPSLGRIYVIFLEGKQEIETGDGTKRIFGYGDILLIEDLSGRGHRTRAVSNGGISIILTLN
ncbi:MAG: hypothetical protein ABI597_13960 [Gammaproteobacteria bacterium]